MQAKRRAIRPSLLLFTSISAVAIVVSQFASPAFAGDAPAAAAKRAAPAKPAAPLAPVAPVASAAVGARPARVAVPVPAPTPKAPVDPAIISLERFAQSVERLTLEMNRARQATITKELMEIVGGAEALKG